MALKATVEAKDVRVGDRITIPHLGPAGEGDVLAVKDLRIGSTPLVAITLKGKYRTTTRNLYRYEAVEVVLEDGGS